MTETVNTTQDEIKKDPPQPPSSPMTKSKAVKQANEGNDRSKSTDKAEKPPTKVVVRRLPPTMNLETFLDQVAPLPPVDYMYFVIADSSLAPNAFARAYLHFVHVADLLIFTEKFDNYVFVDSKGNEYPAIVEYAPFQRIPKQRSTRKKDPRVGTIENDPYYQEFIEALKAEESQRKSASKTNKQHFFETSASTAAPKVTSTPLLEFLKARRADKLRTKEDKIAERKKREIERRKAREDARSAVKPVKLLEGDSDGTSPLTPQIKIAGHRDGSDKLSKDTCESKRFSKDSTAKDIASKRREDDRIKLRDKEKERKDKDKEGRDFHKDSKRDSRKDSAKDQTPLNDRDKDKENQPSAVEGRSKESRRSGKSYQEERQRLNDRRQAAKGSAPKIVPNARTERSDESVYDESSVEKKATGKKDFDTPTDSRSHHQDKYRGSEQHRAQSSRDSQKFDKSNKTGKEQEQRRSYDSKKNTEDRHNDEGSKSTSAVSNDIKSEETSKANHPKEETRKKSYNQEREQRRKNQSRRDTIQSSKSEEKLSSIKGSNSEATSELEAPSEGKSSEKLKDGKGRRPSLDNTVKKATGDDEPSRSKSLADIKTSQAISGSVPAANTKKESTSSRGEDKKDPRTERRIRNKDRPSIEIYRPGMGRFSRQRLEREKVLTKGSSTERDSPSSSPSPVPAATKAALVTEKTDE